MMFSSTDKAWGMSEEEARREEARWIKHNKKDRDELDIYFTEQASAVSEGEEIVRVRRSSLSDKLNGLINPILEDFEDVENFKLFITFRGIRNQRDADDAENAANNALQLIYPYSNIGASLESIPAPEAAPDLQDRLDRRLNEIENIIRNRDSQSHQYHYNSDDSEEDRQSFAENIREH